MTQHKFIPVSQPALIGNEKRYVLDCLETNWISSIGKYIGLFEERFTAYIGTKCAVACSNGTAALHLALLTLGIGPGDEVIIPTLTYIATANAVRYVGAKVVLVDCELDTWCLSVDDFKAKITPKTKAVIPVHLYGHPCNMDPILEAAQAKGIYVIEDAAEALGSKYKGRSAGSMGDIATFSFYGNKTITTGEGGMVVCQNDALADRVRLFKGQGMSQKRRYWFEVVGYNYRMTNIQAAIGLAQLENIAHFIEKRRQIAEWYSSQLADIPGITLPAEKDYAFHSYWMYSILIEEEYGMSRDALMAILADNGIETRPLFYPMHIMPVYDKCSSNPGNAESVASKGINLPTFYELEERDIAFITSVLRGKCQQ